MDVEMKSVTDFVRRFGAVQMSGNSNERVLTPSSTPPDIGLEHAPIEVARIGL